MLTIRQAREADLDGMRAVVRAAIVRHYARTMGEQGASACAAKLDTAALERSIAAAMVIIAEEAGALLGFATFDSKTGEIELCCVPDAERRAIPAALLAVIETEARSRGLEILTLRAMLETEPLYAASGYAVPGGTGKPDFADGTSLPRATLEKRLVYTEPRPERRRNGSGSAAPTLT